MRIYRKIYRRLSKLFLVNIFYPIKYFCYEVFHNDYTILTASVSPFFHNWGDDVSKKLCELINPDNKYIIRGYTWNVFEHEDVLSIGSIITWMTTPNSVIWGSGIVYPDKELSAKPKKVLAVRGPLTRDYLLKRGVDCPKVYGDPALLFPLYYQPSMKKKYRLGIIPHFRDKRNKILRRFRHDESIIIINVQDIHPWHKFIDDICSCNCIISSSLHGIIIADAYGIPNQWVEFPYGESKRFAMNDYLCSVGRKTDSPIILNDNLSVDDIINTIVFEDISFDPDQLLKACPFLNTKRNS